ncbi:MAG TPA: hypothetical protein VFA66_03925 [Gaiellaceae bacterium]|nr:hypothetical protein [Gaiellaceae bacterium]
MSIQNSTAGSRETPTRAGTDRDREPSPDANITSPSRADTLVDAWLDNNRQLIEANKFLSLAIEPDAIANDTPGRTGHTWLPPTWARRHSGRLLRA